MHDHILFRVTFGNVRYITWARDREAAKRNAHHWIGGDPEQYEVEPLTSPGDLVHVSMTLYV